MPAWSTQHCLLGARHELPDEQHDGDVPAGGRLDSEHELFQLPQIGSNTPAATPVTTAVSHIYGPLLSGLGSSNAAAVKKKAK